ncbi:hypothetical protein H8356DRAFT_1675780 [Neocallimastix lanati (nom. inval.)]|jgi:hypothetical protein|uniref:Mediator complex subunit 8 n=1 Tax=Neocallimastix californiae TaxID=1754190 RepID=A0A1Y2AHE3_9FUNG|nr:hypothetical protein H8356DRAFT_1675780 [Neocallimastix sp. JGI-2020a]ORY21395.1 hypothetical protein LY90DRAFT_676280 [Neocallimastix californiae]|eukprot:ORY21395.1 hypothetical protein LY90DRAFT_676280 [Neocallimastix californiae]
MDILNNLTIHLSNETSIDAKELETIKIKLTQLNESLTSFLNLHPQTPWPLILDKFNILISRYSQLLQVVSCKFLKECVIHPESLPEVDPDSLPRFLLRTKFIPEIEEMESNLIVSIAGDNNQYNWIDETKMKEVLKTWENQINNQDEISEKAINFFENERKKYDFKKRIPLNEKRKRLRPELPRRRKHRASVLKKRMLSSQSKLETSPLSQTLILSSSNLGTETEDSKSMLSETITDLGTITDSETSSIVTESTNIVEEKDSDEDESNDDLTSKATSKIMSGDEDSVITSATGTTTSTTSMTLNSSKLGSFYGAKRINRTSTLRNELDYNSESDYEDTYNYDESSSESEKESEKKETENDKKQENKKLKSKINIPEFNSQEGILEKMICWLERGGEFK